MSDEGRNLSPSVFEADVETRPKEQLNQELDPLFRDPIDQLEVFELVKNIKDPEHPHTLQQLNVVNKAHIQVDDKASTVKVNFTPTIPHCSMATLIGLSIRVKLLHSLPMRFKVDVNVTPGSHVSDTAINKQLNDKERVLAALENDNLLRVVNQCIMGVDS